MRIPSFRFRHIVAAPLIALILASCGPQKNVFAPACPVPGLLRPLGELARYEGASRDIRDLVVRARIVDIAGKCEPGDDDNTIVAKALVVVDAARGPRMKGDAITLPVFMAVTDAGAIRDKILFTLPVEFPRNVDSARTASQEIRMELPITPQKSGAAYGIVAGFQLTPEEVAAWRRDHAR